MLTVKASPELSIEMEHTSPARRRQVPAGGCLGTRMAQMKEGIDYLVLLVRYLRFDVEATRREHPIMAALLGDT